ncbi:hypothetical protein LPW26_14205 [Rhodopseudomonas sp. HC1]|uniref:hypothetical protein n=1 Tax=Rhodopseudomonas infernalis TaxID=2897386 RepID=UPI001EE8947D|nr:hypothetical protein [Rhodopseudomonas infernalis]MCG6205801.1 hypothetical protein [Rhodopseudomonas infernalis]
MPQHLIKTCFDYSCDFIPRNCRRPRTILLKSSHFIAIEVVDDSSAPVAFNIIPSAEGAQRFGVRLSGGALWWPIFGPTGPLTADQFLTLERQDRQVFDALLDPLSRTSRSAEQTYDDFFFGKSGRVIRSDRDDRRQQVDYDAARIAIIGEIVFVEAGEPVWYVVRDRSRSSVYDLCPGHSSLDRRDDGRFSTPGPALGVRQTTARLGRAYGLNEIDAGLEELRPAEVRYSAEVRPTGLYECSSSSDLCAQALVRYLWELAWGAPQLRKLFPQLKRAAPSVAPPRDLSYRSVLRDFASSTDPKINFHNIIDDARTILARWDRQATEQVDDDVIGQLSSRDLFEDSNNGLSMRQQDVCF